jgi:hypothetical protein
MSNQLTPRGLPFAFKLFGLPLVFLGGLVAAFWPVSRFTNVFSATFIALAWLPLIGRDHHICTQEDRPKNVPDCGAGLWFPVSAFRIRWRGWVLSRPLSKQKPWRYSPRSAAPHPC